MTESFDHLIKVAKVEEGKSHAQVIYDAPTTHFHSDTTQNVEEILTQVLFDYLISSTVDVDNPTQEQIQKLKTLCIQYIGGIRFEVVEPSSDVHTFHTYIGRVVDRLTPYDFSPVYVIALNLIRYSIPMIPIANSKGSYLPSGPGYEPFSINPYYHVVSIVSVPSEPVSDLLLVVKRVRV